MMCTSLTVTNPFANHVPECNSSGSTRSRRSTISMRTGRFSLSSSKREVCRWRLEP